MKRRLITVALLCSMLLAAMWGAVARAQVLDTNLDITEFTMAPVQTPHAYDPKQAGGNSDVSLFFRFCGPGDPITNVQPLTADPTNPQAKFRVTTLRPHGVVAPFTFVKIRGVRTVAGANSADVNGVWIANQYSPGGVGDPNKFDLVSRTRPPDGDDAFAPVTADAPNGHAQIATRSNPYGCEGQQDTAKLAGFKLKLPPGFLGSPTALETCPTFLFIAASCSDRSILGHSVTETVIDGASNFTPPTRIPTPIYNVQTLGLEPARLGTSVFPSEPAGPFPIKIDLRTDGDYGIDSALIDIPKNLGGPQALITQIETVLCAQVPCKAADYQDPRTVQPLAPTRPFFRNPTSCKAATATLEARSWAVNAITKTKTSSFTPTNCQAEPFTPGVSVTPTETNQSGAAGSQRVTLEYPNYTDADIWQANLKDADITLPEGMVLNPAGGYGLEACSFDQFGVSAAGKQLDKSPSRCPDASQIGTINVTSPVLDFPLGGKAFFGPVSGPGRPTPANPWKLFLLIEGAGLRIKLVGDVTVSESGQVHNVFTSQPEVPFTKLDVNLRGNGRAILRNPNDCGTFNGAAALTGWNNKVSNSTPSVTTTGCATHPRPFNPVVEAAEGIPNKAGANSISRIVFSRPDGDQNLKSLNLSLPAGAAGSLAAAPQCPLAQAQAGTCPESTRIGTIRNTVGVGDSLLTVPGEIYLSEAIQPGDAASIAVRVPAKVGPIDLGQVVLMNRIYLRESDNGLEVVSTEIPAMLEGVPLPIKRVEILVDRQGFFLNPTGCEPRNLTATFFGDEGAQSSSTIALDATGCAELPFGPKIRLIAGAAGKTDQFDHPPFQATVTQRAGEADITNARVVLPAILRPNVPFFNEPGALCNDAQAATDTCPAKSKVGNARAFSPLLPYPISGPVHIVQEIGNVLPKVYVFLRGPTGLEVLLKARNSFLGGRRIINTFESVPDLPQSYFELNLNGGSGGILNNFDDLCSAKNIDRVFDATFTSHSGKKVTTNPHLEIRGCEESDLRAASLTSGTVKVSKKGVGKMKIRCKRSKACKGRLTLKGKGVTSAVNFKISGKKSKSVKLKFSKPEVKKIRKAGRLATAALLKIGDANADKGRVTLTRGK